MVRYQTRYQTEQSSPNVGARTPRYIASFTLQNGLDAAHNPKVAGSNPAPAIPADKAVGPKKPRKPADRDLKGHRKVAFVVRGEGVRERPGQTRVKRRCPDA